VADQLGKLVVPERREEVQIAQECSTHRIRGGGVAGSVRGPAAWRRGNGVAGRRPDAPRQHTPELA
jgi:hypothetical protein